MSSARFDLKNRNVTVSTEAFGGNKPIEVVVVAGHGKEQRLSYVWIGEVEGHGYASMNRRQMRKLRDALTAALGESE